MKIRVRTHLNTYKDPNKKSNTEMAKEVHKIKNNGQRYSTSWKILDKSVSFKPGDTYCRLCVLEKYYILFKSAPTDVNKFRLEKCRHKERCYLAAVT